MSVFDMFTLFGGLALFLYGMKVMGDSLIKLAGGRLNKILGSITSSPFKGFVLGLAVTTVIQSSSATTVMVVGFVNSGLMNLTQATSIIMGANLGASITSWLISTTGITGEGAGLVLQFFKPTVFTPVLAFIGMLLVCFNKKEKNHNIGHILLGFSVLMFGMEFMSGAVKGLQNVPAFTNILTLFSNPFLGVLVGTIFTAIIQSSGASVGILQALSMTGKVTYATAVPVIMGQNIGTCISALIACIGTNKNAKRSAVIHLMFNVIATVILLPIYYIVISLVDLPIIAAAASPVGIAVVHTGFKIAALLILMPCTKLLVKLSCLIVPDSRKGAEVQLLDERLLATPAVAIERAHSVAVIMAETAVSSLKKSIESVWNYSDKIDAEIRDEENQVDTYEDKLGTYLVKVSALSLTENDSIEVNKLLHMIGDFERISDHAVNILESAEEIKDKKLTFSETAKSELKTMFDAVNEILDIALSAFEKNDLELAITVEPLEQVIDYLKDYLKTQHILRLQHGECTIEMGFVLSDLLTNLERVSDHCSNIACCLIEISHDSMDVHEYIRGIKSGKGEEAFNRSYEMFREKYAVK